MHKEPAKLKAMEPFIPKEKRPTRTLMTAVAPQADVPI